MHRITSARVKNPPEYKKFRAAGWAIYLLLACWVCGGLYVYVYLGARARQGVVPDMPAAGSVDAANLTACMDGLESLHGQLHTQIQTLIRTRPVEAGRVAWEEWSPGWRAKLLEVGARCRLEVGDVPGSRNLKVAFDRLKAVHRQYTTMVTQYSKEIGPHIDSLDLAMKQARESVGSN